VAEAARDDAGVESVDFDALAIKIARTDWDYAYSDDHRVYRRGEAQVRETLGAIAQAGATDPVGTSALIDRFADKNPNAVKYGIVQQLRSAFDSVEQRQTPEFPTNEADVSSQQPGRPAVQSTPLEIHALPVYRFVPTDIVSTPEHLDLNIDLSVRVIGRTPDSSRVVARNGGGVLSISLSAFDEAPAAGQNITVSRDNGKVHAVSNRTAELALER
jgi:hypothetical protein